MSPIHPDVKSLFASRTFWANLITCIIAAATGLTGAEWVQQHPQVASGIIGTVGMLNIVLRWVTSQPVTLTGNK